jgi:adenine-specific DNA-methyltransferase
MSSQNEPRVRPPPYSSPVSTANLAINGLVDRVRREVTASVDERLALARVLSRLDIAPGDAAWADGRDVVGEAFERLVPTAGRRRLGQFFTPLWVARAMAEWLLAEPTNLLLDPGIGSGSLMIAAAQVRRDPATRLLGLDIDPLALEMARTTRHVRDIDGLELRAANFLVDDLNERPQAIICNPPYTRHQNVPPELKAAVHDGLSERLKRSFSRLASLHVLFLLRALEVSADDARIAFLTPAHWLDMNYAREIKALLLERAHVEALVSFPVEGRVFEHAVTTAGVTLIRKGESRDRPTRVVHLQAMASAEAGLRAAIGGSGPCREVVLRSADKWSRMRPAPASSGVTLGDLAHVCRGVATGCNAFFVLSENRRRELQVGKRDLVPCIASPRHFGGVTLRHSDLEAMDGDVPRWLLKLSKAPRSGPLASYLHRGRTEFGVRDRTLVRQRVKAGRKWFEIQLDLPAPILFRYLNVSRARFVRNEAGATPLNNWLAIRPLPGVEVNELFAILQELAQSMAMEDESRHYGKGLWKLEPSELRDLVLPASAAALRPPARPAHRRRRR